MNTAALSVVASLIIVPLGLDHGLQLTGLVLSGTDIMPSVSTKSFVMTNKIRCLVCCY